MKEEVEKDLTCYIRAIPLRRLCSKLRLYASTNALGPPVVNVCMSRLKIVVKSLPPILFKRHTLQEHWGM